ncbi:MAG: MarR family transcriptional regulator [Myxococcales bacterium]|nr:MarR family transcriptional regulator [Myxococcales bacterium]
MSWTFLSNHAHVLVCLARDPEQRVRDLAVAVGLTERAVVRILGELAADGYVEITREGRRNRYRILGGRGLRHPVEAGVSVEALLALITDHDGSSMV